LFKDRKREGERERERERERDRQTDRHTSTKICKRTNDLEVASGRRTELCEH
jgi:hypothetical protein